MLKLVPSGQIGRAFDGAQAKSEEALPETAGYSEAEIGFEPGACAGEVAGCAGASYELQNSNISIRIGILDYKDILEDIETRELLTSDCHLDLHIQ